MAAKHTHLDMRVRDRGECPGCDVFWEAQDARLANVRTNTAERQIATLTEKEAARWQAIKWCTAMGDDTSIGRLCEVHTCDQEARHKGSHHCPACGTDWTIRGRRR